MQKSLYTIYIFTKINTKRFFRDRLALFFTLAFPLIFLLVLGGIFSSGSDASFKVAVIDHSNSDITTQFLSKVQNEHLLEVVSRVPSLDAGKQKLDRGQITAIIVFPKNFGEKQDAPYPEGTIGVYYTQNNAQAGQTLAATLEGALASLNGQFVDLQKPFSVSTNRLNTRSLSMFDYLFAGILGFSIIGLGIFGPTNVFPELKKQGILRRFHTTPLSVYQFFISNALSRTIEGGFALALLFIVGILVFDITIVGNYFLLVFWLAISILMILGIGLAIGGWAKNQQQVAPLTNLVVFPMLFLSGTFFPRYLMPDWLQVASTYLPLTPVIEGIRRIVTEGASINMLKPELLLIIVWMVVVYYIAFRIFRWE